MATTAETMRDSRRSLTERRGRDRLQSPREVAAGRSMDVILPTADRMRAMGGTARAAKRASVAAVLFLVSLPWQAGTTEAQGMGDVFRRVNPAVVVIRAKGRDVEVSGLARYTETGSGVLISSAGSVMTAAHVVHSLDEVSVEFLGGETVAARVVSSEPAADLALLKLERVPRESRLPRWRTPTPCGWAIRSSSSERRMASATP